MEPNYLREVRKARRMSIWGLSAMSGVSPTTISAIERWGYPPRDGVRQRLADTLETQIGDIWPNRHDESNH